VTSTQRLTRTPGTVSAPLRELVSVGVGAGAGLAVRARVCTGVADEVFFEAADVADGVATSEARRVLVRAAEADGLVAGVVSAGLRAAVDVFAGAFARVFVGVFARVFADVAAGLASSVRVITDGDTFDGDELAV
jgi:hypothetical protein